MLGPKALNGWSQVACSLLFHPGATLPQTVSDDTVVQTLHRGIELCRDNFERSLISSQFPLCSPSRVSCPLPGIAVSPS